LPLFEHVAHISLQKSVTFVQRPGLFDVLFEPEAYVARWVLPFSFPETQLCAPDLPVDAVERGPTSGVLQGSRSADNLVRGPNPSERHGHSARLRAVGTFRKSTGCCTHVQQPVDFLHVPPHAVVRNVRGVCLRQPRDASSERVFTYAKYSQNNVIGLPGGRKRLWPLTKPGPFKNVSKLRP